MYDFSLASLYSTLNVNFVSTKTCHGIEKKNWIAMDAINFFT